MQKVFKEELDKLETEHTNLKSSVELQLHVNQMTKQSFSSPHVTVVSLLMTVWTLAEEHFQSLASDYIFCLTAESDKEIEALKAELESLKKQLEAPSPVCAYVKNKSEAR